MLHRAQWPIFLCLTLLASCSDHVSEAYRAPKPCTTADKKGYCLVLDRVQLSQIGVELQKHPKYWCAPKDPNPEDTYCDLIEGGQLSVSWFGTVPTIVKIRKVNGMVSYVEMLYTFNEFDHLAEPMKQQYGKPTDQQMVDY